MKISKRINVYRKKFTQLLTRNIGNKRPDVLPPPDAVIKRVLICRPNHRLGNTLLITPLVQEIMHYYPECTVDLFVKGNLAPIVFQNYESVKNIIRLPKKHFSQLVQYFAGWLSIRRTHYDLVVNVDEKSSSGRLATKAANAKYRFFGGAETLLPVPADQYRHMAIKPVVDFRNFIGKSALQQLNTHIPSLDLRLSRSEVSEGRRKLHEIIDPARKTICLFTFATGTKCLPKDWWKQFYTDLRTHYPNYNIIEVLPVENISQLEFSIPYFYSRDLREIGSMLANSNLFLGADSGMMHLSAAAHCPTIGLFSASNLRKYQPYGENNAALDVKIHSFEEIIALADKVLFESNKMGISA
ncbi:MAG TPA: glycosyltransferase family 9 protein [Flavobacterium sp.]|jgi:ADP-heptose:LPS heptosyltransferase